LAVCSEKAKTLAAAFLRTTSTTISALIVAGNGNAPSIGSLVGWAGLVCHRSDRAYTRGVSLVACLRAGGRFAGRQTRIRIHPSHPRPHSFAMRDVNLLSAALQSHPTFPGWPLRGMALSRANAFGSCNGIRSGMPEPEKRLG
jgi:hypothetical protein